MKIVSTLYLVVLLLCLNAVNAQLTAFPTAEGAGKFTTGGRGNTSTAPTIYIVNTLTDVSGSASTPGTFRYACTNGSAARIVIFRVSGTIRLTSNLSLKANTTIAGQTAPGDGICLADYPVLIGGNNIIIRFMRFRLGDKNQAATAGNDDALGSNGNARNNIVIDHCSISWSNDEALSLYKGSNSTIQWNFITEPLDRSYHDEGSGVQNHSYGGIQSGIQMSIHHNLYAHLRGRAPRFDGLRNSTADTVDYRNNVLYNWADYNVNGGEGGTYNVVNNYYKYGPNTPTSTSSGVNRRNMLINPYKDLPTLNYGRYFLTGNYCDNSTTVTNNNWRGAAMNSGTLDDTTTSKVFVPFSHQAINNETALSAYISVLASAGCNLPKRDTLDIRIVNDVKNRTGKLIDCQGGFPSQTPFSTSQTAWPTLLSGTAQTDTDADGMPDSWELARGLNPNLATDRNGYISTSGFNNIENYINGDTIVAVGMVNTCIDAKPILSNNTNQWIHARDTTFSGSFNTNYTSAVDSNHIVASIFDNGNFGKINVSYHTTLTNRVDVNNEHYARRNITITPENPALITQPVTVRIYISKAELDALKAADPRIVNLSDLIIAKSNDNTCINTLPSSYSFLNIINSGVFGTYSNGYYLEFETSSFSTFFIQYKNVIVAPIKLNQFNVQKINNQTAKISWSTEQEINNKHFVLQKSKNGLQFENLATINGAGNSTVVNYYSFIDNNLFDGTQFYRLQQVDYSNKITYSEIKKLFVEKATAFQITPNPVQQYLQTKVNTNSNYLVTIYDNLGKKVLQQLTNNNQQINTSNLNSGLYFLTINTTNNFYSTKIQKQ